MNKGLLALNIILLAAVGMLFFLFFTKKNDRVIDKKIDTVTVDSLPRWQNTPVAYFDMDSVEANFTEFKKMQSEVVAR